MEQQALAVSPPSADLLDSRRDLKLMQSEDLLFHLAIGSRYENIELVQVVLADSLERLGVDGEARHWIDVAVREAVANAIKHGNLQEPEKKVEVDLATNDGELVIRVFDQGTGFDPGALDSPLDPANLLRPSGRGIFYMQSFMDEVAYEPRSGGGTVVILRKKLGERDGHEGQEGGDHEEERG